MHLKVDHKLIKHHGIIKRNFSPLRFKPSNPATPEITMETIRDPQGKGAVVALELLEGIAISCYDDVHSEVQEAFAVLRSIHLMMQTFQNLHQYFSSWHFTIFHPSQPSSQRFSLKFCVACPMIWQKASCSKEDSKCDCAPSLSLSTWSCWIAIIMLLLRIIFSLSWTHPQQLPTPNKYLWTGHEILESSPSKLRKGSLQQVPLSIRKVGSINACWVFDRGTWIHPANLVMTNPFFLAKILPFSSEMIKIYVSKNHLVNNINFLAVFPPFWLATGPHLLMFLNVLDGFFFINLSQGSGYPLPWKM